MVQSQSNGPSGGAADVGIAETSEFVLKHRTTAARRILEVGCGDGALAHHLTTLGFHLTAVDRSPDAVQAAVGRGIEARCADWTQYEDMTHYDIVLFVRSLHHIQPLGEAVRRSAVLLAPGGCVLIDDFDVAAPDARTTDWLQREMRRIFAACPEEQAPPDESLAGKLLRASDSLATWRDHHQHHAPIHSADLMESALGTHFPTVHASRCPYLYRYAAFSNVGREVVSQLLQHERAALAAGEILHVGRRFVARARGVMF